MIQRVRFWLVVVGLVYVLGSPDPGGSLALSVLLAPWIARTSSGRRALAKRVRAVVPLWLGLVLSWLVLAAVSGERSWLLLAQVYPIGARVLAATLLLSWLTHDLTALQLERALRAARLPTGFVTLVMETRAFAAQLSETLHAAWAACALRAGLGSLRALRQTVGAVAGIVILRSIDRSERVATASALRGVGMDDS
jgi:hypothetical protein